MEKWRSRETERNGERRISINFKLFVHVHRHHEQSEVDDE